MTKRGRADKHVIPPRIAYNRNPGHTHEKGVSGEEAGKKGQRLLTGLLGFLTPRHVLVLNDFGSEEAVELCGG